MYADTGAVALAATAPVIVRGQFSTLGGSGGMKLSGIPGSVIS